MNIKELKSMPIETIREIYREYLNGQNLSPNTIQSSCTDAFYLLRNDGSINFWDMLERPDYEKIAFEHLKSTLKKISRGNINANINGYMAHIRRFKRFVDGDSEIRLRTAKQHESNATRTRSLKRNKEDGPHPSIEKVEKYLRLWDQHENYHMQERALDKLFVELCPNNKDILEILLKASTLNDFYSTHIYSIYPVAKHILNLNIDERLRAGDDTLVTEIQDVIISGRKRHFYSFATKYCSHHNPSAYPIYDSYVDKVLRYFRDVDGFYKFRGDALKNYAKFKSILLQFRAFYGLKKYSLKQIDKYLWQLGKDYFPNNYGKAKTNI